MKRRAAACTMLELAGVLSIVLLLLRGRTLALLALTASCVLLVMQIRTAPYGLYVSSGCLGFVHVLEAGPGGYWLECLFAVAVALAPWIGPAWRALRAPGCASG